MDQKHRTPGASHPSGYNRQRADIYARLRTRAAKLRVRLTSDLRAGRSTRDVLLARLPKDSVCAEIGSWKGDFAAKILDSTHPRRLHLIDPWEYRGEGAYNHAMYGGYTPGGQDEMDAIHESVRDRFRTEIERGQVVIRRSRSVDAATGFADGELDWVYIDGDHTYESVKSDLETSRRRRLRRGRMVEERGDQGSRRVCCVRPLQRTDNLRFAVPLHEGLI